MGILMNRLRDNKSIIFPLIHFLLSFLWERFVLLPEDYMAVAFSVPINKNISYGFEQGMCYFVSKLMALLIIWGLWKFLFCVFDGGIKKKTLILWGIIGALFLTISIIQWPDDFLCGGDNYIPFSYSLRLMPEYWHSVLLSCLFTAAMMVFPHAISITLLQCGIFVFALAYVYDRIDRCEKLKNCSCVKYLMLLPLIFRDTFGIATNPERAEINVSFCIIFTSIVVFDVFEKKETSKGKMIGMLFYGAFLAVFRSEGILVGLLGFVVWLIFAYRPRAKDAIAICMCLIMAYYLFSLPGKVGNIKYYGNDYSIVNSFSSLKNILNSENSNLHYEDAEADIRAIDELVPVDIIKEYGIEGYRMLNYAEGRYDINQSMADADTSNAFKSAYMNIVKHNVSIYLKTQWYMMINALGACVEEYSEKYTGQHKELEYYTRELWDVGVQDSLNIPGRYFWTNLNVRNSLSDEIAIIRIGYVHILENSKIYFAGNILELICSIVIIVVSIVGMLRRKFELLGLGIMSLIFDGYFTLVSLVMPVGANMYFHAYFYCMYILIIVTIGIVLKSEKEKKNE